MKRHLIGGDDKNDSQAIFNPFFTDIIIEKRQYLAVRSEARLLKIHN